MDNPRAGRVKYQVFTVLHTEASLGWGGQEIRIVRESLGMILRGYRVIIAAPEESTILRKAREAGIPAFPAEFRKGSIRSILNLKALMEREGVDLLNTHSSSDSWVAGMAAKLCRRKPVIIRTRHLSTPISRSLPSRLIYDIIPDAVMTTGEEIRQKMISHNRFSGEKIISVPTGIDVELFDPGTALPSLEKKGFAVGMVGVLRSWKGHQYFLEAVPLILKEIPETVFYIVGDGPEKQDIRRSVYELSLEKTVIMTGHREDIPGVMASLDVVVHPSYGHEGVPQSVLQALAMERPVVASDVGAVREVVIDRITGLLMQPRSPEQIAEKVIEIFRDTGLGRALGRAGRRLVTERYSLEHMLGEIEDLYRRLNRYP